MSEPTLIELLDVEATDLERIDRMAEESKWEGVERGSFFRRAARLRAAAARLRSEMERAEPLRDMIVNDVKQNNVCRVLERINNGPLHDRAEGAKPPPGLPRETEERYRKALERIGSVATHMNAADLEVSCCERCHRPVGTCDGDGEWDCVGRLARSTLEGQPPQHE